MSQRHRHLSPERMQALLDGELPRREAESLRAEVASCARCSSELEAWQVLFDDLGELSPLDPSPEFGDRILDQVSLPQARPKLLRLFGRRDARTHAAAEELQEYLDGRLATRTSTRLEAHLDGCAECRSEMEGLHRLVTRLDALGHVSPSAGFGEVVMARLRIQQMAQMALAPTTRRERMVAWVREHLPVSNRGWAAVLGMGTAPAVVAALVIHTVFSFELVTLGSLVSFLGFKLSGFLGTASGALEGFMTSTPILRDVISFIEVLGATPVYAAAATALASLAILSAAWILYRNLILPAREEGRYAQVSL